MIAKLMKYEVYRRKTTILAYIILFAVAELLILFGLYKGDSWIALSVVMTILIIGGTYVYALVDTIASYYSDLKNKHGYMLFLTPVSGYQIIGSKALFGLLQLFVTVVLMFLAMFLNYRVAIHLYFTGTEFEELWRQLMEGFKVIAPHIGQLIQFLLIVLLQWFTIIMMGILAVTLSKTIFSNSKHSFLFSLLIYILLSVITQTISVSVLAPFGLFGDMINIQIVDNTIVQSSIEIGRYFTIGIVLYSVYISLFYFLSGRFLHKRIDL